jgi:galactokinase
VPSLGALMTAASESESGSFGQAVERALSRLADPVLRRRARHVICDSWRARQIADALDAPAGPGTFRRIGQLLTDGHASLRDDFEVSWGEADVTVATARTAGALGAKMIGGGFGGSVLALVPAQRLARVRAAVAEELAGRSSEAPGFLEAVPAPAARRLA